MKFEVINENNKVVMQTNSITCIPNANNIVKMASAGYRFKVDGKLFAKKRILEYISAIKEKNNG